MEEQRVVPIKTLNDFMFDFFVRLGVPKEDAQICTDALLEADIQGIDSHGIALLKTYHRKIKAGILYPKSNISIVRETATTATLDGGYGMGQVIGHRAMTIAIDKATEFGLGAVAVRNSNHIGAVGHYALMAVKKNMMGLAVSNASPAIAPTFGVEPMLGTNPLAFGAPSDLEFPFIIDFAVSMVRKNKADHLARIGENILEGWAIDKRGNPYTNGMHLKDDVKAGIAALLPIGGEGELFGGHKGYGLAVMVEILSAALQGGTFMKDLVTTSPSGVTGSFGLGQLFLAMDIKSFIDIAVCKSITGQIMRNLQNSKKMPNRNRVYVAGEKEYEQQKIRLREGIPVSRAVIQDLRTIQGDLAMSDYEFLK